MLSVSQWLTFSGAFLNIKVSKIFFHQVTFGDVSEVREESKTGGRRRGADDRGHHREDRDRDRDRWHR